MEIKNRDCASCLYSGQVYHRTLSGLEVGMPQDFCKVGRRVYVAKPCSDEIPKRSGGGLFIDQDDIGRRGTNAGG